MADWQQALTAQVARNIEHYRVSAGLTRTELAARCSALGLPTKRPALAALLDGHRQTVTLQELVVIAEAIGIPMALLTVPIHTGEQAISGPTTVEHAFAAAERLFAVGDRNPFSPTSYLPYQRFLRAAGRFETTNERLARLSHRLATGTTKPNQSDGRPHPAAEILHAEAALSRLAEAKRDLDSAGLINPPLGPGWSFIADLGAVEELPVLELLGEKPSLPIFVFRLTPDELPAGRLIEGV